MLSLHFSVIPAEHTSHTNQIAEKEIRCLLYDPLPVQKNIPFHSLIEMHHCDENHRPKINRSYKLVLKMLSMPGADLQSLPMPANQDKKYQVCQLYHYYSVCFLSAIQ